MQNTSSNVDFIFGQEDVLDKLNQLNCCNLVTLNTNKLHKELENDLIHAGLEKPLLETHANMFSHTPVFISIRQLGEIQKIIDCIENVIQSAPYRNAISQWAPDIFSFDPKSRGVYIGYDFHLTDQGPQLIEINTNAGGALLNAYLARSQIACCKIVEKNLISISDPALIESQYMKMFQNEWSLQNPSHDLKRIAIVDDEPVSQGMYPEFVLFAKMFARHNLEAIICDPNELIYKDNTLIYKDIKIDLVYNRHCDFYFTEQKNHALKMAYLNKAAVVTPHPRAYALYADKRNLTIFGDPDWLKQNDFSINSIQTLSQGIPKTQIVTSQNADELWQNRKQLFFKPVTGFGSKAVYRGSKLTKKVWAHIIQNKYVAQELVSPGERKIKIDQLDADMKVDFRAYVYNGKIQMLVARLYRGQTTNMQTPGGGFATVFTEK